MQRAPPSLALFLAAALLQLSVLFPAASASCLDDAPYPDWAHAHWIWQNGGELTQQGTVDLLGNYTARGIPVGAVNIDSQWQSTFNAFTPSSKITDLKQLIDQLHASDVRVIFWATSMVNVDCPRYSYALNNSFFIRDALDRQMPPIKWWHGHGCLLDYFNPAALTWWHSQLDLLLDYGADGWKIDGTDPYILEMVTPRAYGGRFITYREYADAEYRDFFRYTRDKLGDDRLIMSRPVDNFGPIYLSFSPRDVVFAGWVGDLDSSWSGLAQGLERMRISSQRTYVNFGTDIAGYRGNEVRETLLYVRWLQLGVFCPLMENGGNGAHAPWLYDNASSTTITDIYRTFAGIHSALGPYLLATGAAAFESNTSAMTFTDDTTYLLGHDILVAPLLSNASDSRTVKFPHGGDWVGWFTNDSYAGGSSATVSAALDQYPVFKRAGSVIAMHGAYAHFASGFDRTLRAQAPTFVFDVTRPLSAGMACIRRGSGSNGSSFIAEYSHDAQGTTRLSAANRGPQSVAFVVSPVTRPVRVYLSQQQQQQQQQQPALVSKLNWFHAGSVLTVVLPDAVDDVFVDWL